MNIDYFTRITKDSFDAFQVWWEEQNENDPELFPLDLGVTEWDEQYQLWFDRVIP
jgi:hypothetical protein